jgi:hypothetical protein
LTTASAENEVSGGDAEAEVGVSVGLSVGSTFAELLAQAVRAKVVITASDTFDNFIFSTYS